MKNIALVVSDIDNPEVKKNLSSLYPKLSEKYKVSVIAFRGSPCDEYEENLEILESPVKPESFLGGLLCEIKRIIAIRKIAKDRNLRLITSLSEEANFAVSYSYLPVKRSIYCASHEEYKKDNKKYVKMLKHTDSILLRSHSLGKLFKEQYPGVAQKIKVVETPIDSENIASLSKEPIPEEHASFFKNRKVIAVNAPFTYARGQWNILKSFNILREHYKTAGLVFLGDGGELSDNIKKMAEQSEFKSDIRFIPESENPYKYIAASAAYVQADICDGGQVYLLEAMATGTPVASTDFMMQDILFDKPDPEFKCDKMTFADNGIITPGFDTRENYDYFATYGEHIDLANAMKELIVSEKIAKLLSDKALTSTEKYGSEKTLKSYIDFIDKLYLCL